MIAGGADDPLAALQRGARDSAAATLVLKRGPMGCVVFPGAIPATLDEGVKGPGFPVEVYNVLGAGDAFMSGFLRGWLRDEPLETCCAYANASGAFAVSRLLCSAEYPTWAELSRFLKHGSPHRALRRDEDAQPHPLGDDAPARAAIRSWRWRSTIARNSRRSPTTPARRASASAPSSCSRSRPAAQGRGRPAGLRHAAGRQIWPRGAVPRRRSWLLDRPPGRRAGLAAARIRVRRLARRQARRMAGRPHDQVPVLLPPRRFRGDEGAAGARTPAPARRRAHARARIADRDHRRASTGRSTTTPSPASSRGSTRSGIKPDWWKLEGQPSEAAWDNVARAIESRRSALPRNHAAWARGAGGGPGAGLRAGARAAAWSRALRSGGRSSSSRRSSGSPGASTTARRSSAWPARLRAWVICGAAAAAMTINERTAGKDAQRTWP